MCKSCAMQCHTVNKALLTSVACDAIENNNEIALIKHDERPTCAQYSQLIVA